MEVSESVSELRRICQRSRESQFYQMPWIDRRVYRGISIYFTKLFLRLRVSANQVTVLSLLIGILSGFFLIIGKPIYCIVGAVALFLSNLLDHSDGEVARYTKSASPTGNYMDGLLGDGILIWYITLALFFGVYIELQNPLVFPFTILAIVSMGTYMLAEYRPFHVLNLWGMLPEVLKSKQKTGREIAGKFNVVKQYAKYFFDIYTLLPFSIIIVSLLDWLIAPITLSFPFVGPLVFNFTFVYLMLFAIVRAAAAVLVVRRTVKKGIKFIPKYMRA